MARLEEWLPPRSRYRNRLTNSACSAFVRHRGDLRVIKKCLAVLALAVVASAAAWLAIRKSAPPEVAFAPVIRETLIDTLSTNGRAEPAEWIAVHSELSGPVLQVAVEESQTVQKGALLAELDSSAARADLAAAEARIIQAKAELDVIQDGGRAADLADIDGALRKAEVERQAAEREVESLTRLVGKKAATGQELLAARDRLAQVQTQIQALQTRRRSLIGKTDRTVAEAKLKEAEAAAEIARALIAKSLLRAPASGVVYSLKVRRGAFIEAGAEVARIGRLERMKVVVYVDEPELGRAAVGMPVTVTWDALPQAKWTGKVDRAPVEITPLGTRQVGEAVCLIDNPGRDLLPGANVNAAIQSNIARDALAVPKESLHTRGGVMGVYLLAGERLLWRPVKTGLSTITRTQILDGLREGERVALPGARRLEDGLAVRPK